MKICEVCGKEYEPKSNYAQSKYCSDECRQVVRAEVTRKYNARVSEKLRNRDHTKICPICGEKFEATHNQTYCSPICNKRAQRRHHDGMSMPYRPKRAKKPNEIKGLDDLMEVFKAEGKTPYDYHEWKVQQALKHVTPIRREL